MNMCNHMDIWTLNRYLYLYLYFGSNKCKLSKQIRTNMMQMGTNTIQTLLTLLFCRLFQVEEIAFNLSKEMFEM